MNPPEPEGPGHSVHGWVSGPEVDDNPEFLQRYLQSVIQDHFLKYLKENNLDAGSGRFLVKIFWEPDPTIDSLTESVDN